MPVLPLQSIDLLKTVFICEDHPLFRQSLEALVENARGFKLVGSCGDGVAAVDALTESAPDLVLLDLNLPKKDGFQILEFLRQHAPETQVVILTSYNDHHLADKAQKIGASAYILKDTNENELVTVLRQVESVEFQTNVDDKTVHDFEEDRTMKSVLRLTRMEKKLVSKLIEGASVAQLAEGFNISENTVKNHKKNIYRKLDVSTQTELILKCTKYGLLD